MGDEPHIPIAECERGHVYRLRSRNLSFGVFAPEKENGFIGIREKFGHLYLFAEYHWDNGPPHGTAHPREDLGPLEDPKIRLVASMPTLCDYCGERLEYLDVEGGVVKGVRRNSGEWRHVSGGEDACDSPSPVGRMNQKLFDALVEIEREHGEGPSVRHHAKEAHDDEKRE